MRPTAHVGSTLTWPIPPQDRNGCDPGEPSTSRSRRGDGSGDGGDGGDGSDGSGSGRGDGSDGSGGSGSDGSGGRRHDGGHDTAYATTDHDTTVRTLPLASDADTVETATAIRHSVAMNETMLDVEKRSGT